MDEIVFTEVDGKKKISFLEAEKIWNWRGDRYSRIETTFENGEPKSILINLAGEKKPVLFEIEK